MLCQLVSQMLQLNWNKHFMFKLQVDRLHVDPRTSICTCTVGVRQTKQFFLERDQFSY